MSTNQEANKELAVDQEIYEYLMQLAPHVSDRKAAKLLKTAAETIGVQRAKLTVLSTTIKRLRKEG